MSEVDQEELIIIKTTDMKRYHLHAFKNFLTDQGVEFEVQEKS